MSEPIFDDADDALLVLEQPGSRSALQSADIILGAAASITAGVRWIGTTFDAYPGCVVAGACHEQGAWALFATRTELRTLVRAGRARLSWQSITALARLVHREEVQP
jgi:hypothetical protein